MILVDNLLREARDHFAAEGHPHAGNSYLLPFALLRLASLVDQLTGSNAAARRFAAEEIKRLQAPPPEAGDGE